MYKLLIVDDDDIVREGLVKNIPWLENGICVISDARNGVEAFACVREHRPDVILTDIKMPLEDGFVFARRVSEEYPEIKIVFLTAYEDFDYAKSAIELKVVDYVLKFAGNQSILAAVKRACEESDAYRQMSRKLELSTEKMREEFIRNLFLGNLSFEALRTGLQDLNIPPEENYYSVAVLHITDFSGFSVYSPYNEELLKYGLMNICRELTCDCKNITCVDFHGKPVLLFWDSRKETLYQQITKILEDILSNIKSYMRVELVVSVGKFYDSPARIYNSYWDAMNGIRFRKSGNSEIIFAGNELSVKAPQEQVGADILSYIDEHYLDPHLRLEDIAASSYVSANYACTVFKKQTGQTINAYILKRRMERAKELILNTDLPVFQIAEAVGYENPRYFSMLFKKYTGLTPLQFREKGL